MLNKISEIIINCDQLFDPDNGDVELTDVTEGSTATYTCDEGFDLSGDKFRTCQSNGQWSGSEPICEGIQHVTIVILKLSNLSNTDKIILLFQ